MSENSFIYRPDNNEKTILDNIVNEKGHIVLDCDGVLCLISPKWVYLLHQNYDYFNKYLHLLDNFKLEEQFNKIMNRPFFYLDQWLFRHEESFDPEEVKEFKRKFIEVYDTPDFYDDLEPTPFGTAMSYAISQPFVKKITIVSRSTQNNRKSKEKFLYNLFNTSRNKLDIYYVDSNETKSDLIKELGNDIGVIAEDELKNIDDIVTNCDNIKNMNFYVPTYGYNAIIDEDLFNKCKEKDINLNYYR